jgi:hypothetical protein
MTRCADLVDVGTRYEIRDTRLGRDTRYEIDMTRCADLVDVGRDGFAAHAHAAAVDEVAILAEGQPPHHHALLRRHHCGAAGRTGEAVPQRRETPGQGRGLMHGGAGVRPATDRLAGPGALSSALRAARSLGRARACGWEGQQEEGGGAGFCGGTSAAGPRSPAPCSEERVQPSMQARSSSTVSDCDWSCGAGGGGGEGGLQRAAQPPGSSTPHAPQLRSSRAFTKARPPAPLKAGGRS